MYKILIFLITFNVLSRNPFEFSKAANYNNDNSVEMLSFGKIKETDEKFAIIKTQIGKRLVKIGDEIDGQMVIGITETSIKLGKLKANPSNLNEAEGLGGE